MPRPDFPLGALGRGQPPLAPLCRQRPDGIVLAVVGAHLSGMPLNHELRASSATFLEATATAPDYRLYALAGSEPAKPGLLRVAEGSGAAIAVEALGHGGGSLRPLHGCVPPPLSIGTIRLADGRQVKGFLAEAQAVAGARDISSFGGWREFRCPSGAVMRRIVRRGEGIDRRPGQVSAMMLT